jgi:glutathione-regulated potassium-efflux system ancillary protein KefC
LMQAMAPHQEDENKLASVAIQGRRQLEELWSRERQERQAQRPGSGWQPPPT